jgi:hypothetical protein
MTQTPTPPLAAIPAPVVAPTPPTPTSPTPPNSKLLHTILAPLLPALDQATSRIWHTESPHATYLAWLRVTHAMLQATPALLQEAADHCPCDEPDLAAYFRRNSRDESGHAAWAAADYLAAKGDPDRLAEFLPPPELARLVGAQYFWIRHADPVALLGHIAVLEAHPPSPRLAAVLAARTGLPDAAFRTLRGHAEADPHHARRLAETLDRTALPPRRFRLVVRSALTTVDALIDLAAHLSTPHPPGGTPWQTSTAWPRSASTSPRPATTNSQS